MAFYSPSLPLQGSDKDKKKHRRSGSQKDSGDEDLPRSPSGGVGPVALSMKMKANPSFQGLAQPYPPGENLSPLCLCVCRH